LEIFFEVDANVVTYTNTTVFTLLSQTNTNVSSMTFTIDGTPVTYPIEMVGGENVNISINRIDDTKSSVVTLHGQMK